DPVEIFLRNSNSVIGDVDLNAVAPVFDANGQMLFRPAGIGAGLFGVTDEIDENLQNLVFFDQDLGRIPEIFDHADVVPRETTGMHAKSVLDEFGHGKDFLYARDFGVALLHRDDVFDMLDVLLQLSDFVQRTALFAVEKGGKLSEIRGDLFSFRVDGQ